MSFRLFGVTLGVLIVVAAVIGLVTGLMPDHSGKMSNNDASFMNAPVAPRFADGCGHPYYPLYADSEMVFGRIKGNDIVDEFSLVTAERSGNEYLRQMEVDQDVRPFSVTCSAGRVEPLAYIDWAGALGEPLVVLKTRNVNGLSLPMDFDAGDRWLTEFVFDADSLPSARVYDAESVVVTLDNQSFVPETLTIPGGQMKVLRVLVHQKIQYLDSEGTETHPSSELDYYEYWAQGKGLVRVHAEKVNEWDYVMIERGVRAN